MAIILREQKKGVNWFVISVYAFLFLVVIGGGWFLFFAKTPGIELVAPSILRETTDIAEARFDPSEVVGHPVLKTLRQYGAPLGIGQLGRTNPLIGF